MEGINPNLEAIIMERLSANREFQIVDPSMDQLENFLIWFLLVAPPIGMIPLNDAVNDIEDVRSVLWYRNGQYQIQMFVVPPNYIIPEHTHPNVDSFELYLGGQARFSLNGKFTITEEEITNPDNLGLCVKRGSIIRVRPKDVHGGVFGPSGGVFMSIQQWLNGVEPHCVALDYDGVTMGPKHFNKVKNGNPVLKEQLTGADAASAEAEMQPKLPLDDASIVEQALMLISKKA